MSVYIKGMEMPTSCEKCPFLDYEEGFCFASGVKGKSGLYEFTWCPCGIKNGRHKDCPLVSVPPHGDLIDRNGIKWIKEEFEERCHNDRWTVVEEIAYKYQVDKLPTIIPASEEGET